MSNSIKSILTELETIFEKVDECLAEWKGDGNLQFPVLIPMVALKANWDAKQLRYNDPIVRFYIRNHPDWHVTRGAHGGIMRATDKQKKDAAKLAKEAAKNQVKEALAAKLAAKPAIDIKSDSSDDDSDDTDSE